ncbi:MAG TPA: hypothetical protein VGC33_13455 [Acerihabitans sp.]
MRHRRSLPIFEKFLIIRPAEGLVVEQMAVAIGVIRDQHRQSQQESGAMIGPSGMKTGMVQRLMLQFHAVGETQPKQ